VTFNRLQLKRYSRQIILPEIALAGQGRLQASSVLVIGAGGLGSPVLTYLVSSGVGKITLAESDTLDLSNLQRQFLYDSSRTGEPKLTLALERLRALNSEITLEGVGQFNAENAKTLASKVDLIVDASDNLETRYLVNDTCLALEKTWVWGAAEGFTGMTAVFDRTLSLRDAFPNPEPRDDCDTIGVFAPVLGVTGSLMASVALRLLVGLEVKRGVLTIHDALEGTTRAVKLRRVPEVK
jgi:molybdopterin-synthase adenylyltransferase